MKITILGSGTSTGVPEVGCKCKVCTSSNAKDNRLRASVLIEVGGKKILIDCGPDFRQQMLHQEFTALDGILITHEHYDHVGGLDDLRPFCRFGEITIYGEEVTLTHLRTRLPYCFAENKYPGVPTILLTTIIPSQPFFVGDVEVMPIRVMHGKLPILGYRIGKVAYITDMLTMSDEEYEKLKGLDCLIINALRINPHHTHQCLKEALVNAERIGAKRTYLIHMSHQIGLHNEVENSLPLNVHLAYDGLVIND
ncbi:MAG: MBL fold metallo-hydrolase [Bacteroides sp.]